MKTNVCYRQRINSEDKNNIKDAEFFKALYCMANLGPICLLNKISLSPTNKGQMTLADILQEGWHTGIHENLEKHTVETDLFMLAMEAACYGHEILEDKLADLCEKWRILLDISNANTLKSATSTEARQITMPNSTPEAVDSDFIHKELQLKLAMNEWIEQMRLSTHQPSTQSYITHIVRAISQVPPSRSGSPVGNVSRISEGNRTIANLTPQGTSYIFLI